MIRFACPKCKIVLQATASQAGATVGCPRCKFQMKVPSAAAVSLQPLRVVADPGQESQGWGSPWLFAASALAALTVAALLVLGWAFFGRGDGESSDPDRVAQDGGGKGPKDEPAKRQPDDPTKVPTDKKQGDNGKPTGDTRKPTTDSGKTSGDTGKPTGDTGKPTGDTTKPPPVPVAAVRSDEEVYKQLLKSCVWIVATDGKKVTRADSWRGSGVFVDRDERLVLTNEHVANDSCTEVLVLFPMYKNGKQLVSENSAYWDEINKGDKGKAIPAKVLSRWVDKKRDLALIQLQKDPPEEVVPIRVSNRSVSPGQKIHTIGGNPEGNKQGQWIYSNGAVRQVSLRQWQYEEDDFKRSALVIASQVPINHGDSGGPVVDSRGVLVGINALGGNFRLVDRRHWLRMARHEALAPGELRCIERRHLHHADPDVAVIVDQLAANRLGEALDRVLGGAVGRLQGDATIRQRRANLDDRATVARQHPLQRCQRSVDETEIGHLGDAAVVGGHHLSGGREDGAEGVVNPHVNRAKFLLDGIRGPLHCVGVGHVGRQKEGPSTQELDIAPAAL